MIGERPSVVIEEDSVALVTNLLIPIAIYYLFDLQFDLFFVCEQRNPKVEVLPIDFVQLETIENQAPVPYRSMKASKSTKQDKSKQNEQTSQVNTGSKSFISLKEGNKVVPLDLVSLENPSSPAVGMSTEVSQETLLLQNIYPPNENEIPLSNFTRFPVLPLSHTSMASVTEDAKETRSSSAQHIIGTFTIINFLKNN